MRHLLACVLVVAACKSDTSTNPVAGGGDGGNVDSPKPILVDAPPGIGDGAPGTDGGFPTNGRVCLASDPRQLVTAVSPTACAATGAGGLRVQLDAAVEIGRASC